EHAHAGTVSAQFHDVLAGAVQKHTQTTKPEPSTTVGGVILIVPAPVHQDTQTETGGSQSVVETLVVIIALHVEAQGEGPECPGAAGRTPVSVITAQIHDDVEL